MILSYSKPFRMLQITLRQNPVSFTVAPTTLCDLPPITLPSSPSSAPATWAFLLFLELIKLLPYSRPLCVPSPMPGIVLLLPSSFLGSFLKKWIKGITVCSNVAYSESSYSTTLSKIELLLIYPQSHSISLLSFIFLPGAYHQLPSYVYLLICLISVSTTNMSGPSAETLSVSFFV